MFLMFPTSRSGMFLSLLLGCSPLTLADTPPGHNEDTPGGLWDDCDYASGEYWRCGDICIYGDGLCECGNTTLRYKQVLRYHCCTSTSCTQSGDTVSCPGGQVRDISEQCEDGRCYGDYNTSQHLSYHRSRYSCSGDQEDCLPLQHMCAGLSSCGDSQVCNEELRCADDNGEVEIIRLNTSQVQHSFCQYPDDLGDKSYSSIDRSDENITNTINIKESPKIDYSYLTLCNNSQTNSPGVTCYETANQSDRPPCNSVSFEWCRSDLPSSCVTSQDGTRTVTDDSRLCSNKTF